MLAPSRSVISVFIFNSAALCQHYVSIDGDVDRVRKGWRVRQRENEINVAEGTDVRNVILKNMSHSPEKKKTHICFA